MFFKIGAKELLYLFGIFFIASFLFMYKAGYIFNSMPLVKPATVSLSKKQEPCKVETAAPSRQEVRKIRFDKPVAPEDVKIVLWTGSISMAHESLHKVINNVLRSMPHLKNTSVLHQLIFETAAAESDCGRYKVECKPTEDLGMFQLRLSTVLETLAWLKTVHPDVYSAIEKLRLNNISLQRNIEMNLSFGVALCATYYWRRDPQAYLGTVTARGQLWKSQYNSSLGKGSVGHYVRQAEAHTNREVN